MAVCFNASAETSVRLAVFGGTESCAPVSRTAKELWRDAMPCTWDDYGADGAGFVAGRETGMDIPAQVKKAFASGAKYDMFVFWCSAADALGGKTLAEQEAAFRTSVDLVRRKSPRSPIVLFTSSRLPLSADADRSLKPFAEAQTKLGETLILTILDCYRHFPFPADRAATCFGADGKSLTEDGYAFLGGYQAKFLKCVRLNGWGLNADYFGGDEEAKRMARRTQRLHDAKWGVFNHYLGYGITSAAEWKAKVDAFDVRKVADQLEACGAGFYFITLMQGCRWMCAPNAAYDRIAGTKPGEACATRDLPMELSEELGKRGIDLYLYFTGDGPYLDDAIGSRFGLTEPRFLGVSRPFVEKWSSVLEAFAVRYGSRVKGWWIDGCYDKQLGYTDDLLQLYAQAVRKGNPDAVIAMNNGVEDRYLRYSQHADFTAGEFQDFFCVPPERFVQGAQSFALIPLGAWGKKRNPGWGRGGCKRSADYVADYVKLVNANGGVVAIDVKVAPDGSWDPEQMEVLKAVGRKTGSLAK